MYKEAVLTDGYTLLHCKLPSLFLVALDSIFDLELDEIVIVLLNDMLKILGE